MARTSIVIPETSDFIRRNRSSCMERVLVTGGCGFIGSNFIHYLLEKDATVSIVNFDCLTYAGNPANLAAVADNPRYRFVQGDIADRDAVRKVVREGLTAIIN